MKRNFLIAARVRKVFGALNLICTSAFHYRIGMKLKCFGILNYRRIGNMTFPDAKKLFIDRLIVQFQFLLLLKHLHSILFYRILSITKKNKKQKFAIQHKQTAKVTVFTPGEYRKEKTLSDPHF